MPSVSLRTNSHKFQEESSDLETQLLELGFLCENENAVGQTAASFSYNAHGSTASMPHLSAMDWDFAEKLRHITRGTTEAYYSYDGNGIRTRKVVEKNGIVETRLYLGGFEIWRKTVNGVLDTERETLHVMDDQRRIALVETLTVENGNRIANPAPVQRYQLDNHLGSASLELDASANIISYEEYYPYGDTSYRAGRNASEVSRKRYRYTGKEKDEESSLYYCEQRYYAAHISRWGSTDPTWLEDGINLYAYVNGNPVSGVDPSGTQTIDDISPLPSSVDKNAKSSSDDYDVKYDKAMANEALVNEIKKHVLPNLGKEGKKEVESIIDMIKDGSFEKEIYKEGVAEKPTVNSDPTNFDHLIKDEKLRNLYYIARARDYQIRNNTNEIPQYYVEYGAKYMFAFKYDTRNELSEQGQRWLDDTLINLQNEMENIVSENPQCETIPKEMSGSLKELAFKSHEKAYLKAGFCNVAGDWVDIALTPDLSDLWNGKRESLRVGLKCLIEDVANMAKKGVFIYDTGMPNYNASRMFYNMK